MDHQFVEIAFRQAGELFLFDAGDLSLEVEDRVVVETEHGQALGTVKSIKDSSVTPPTNFKLYRVVRMASSEDIGREQRHQRKEKEAYEYCNQKIGEMGLPMKLIKAEYFFSGSKLLFYFSAEGRVDFRMLVRDLARYFQKRIEMRQIGVRDSAKLIGGVGPCGQQLCCNRFLRQFNPVSIRMAKDQSLPLNPQKVSGVCGRLMCCLAYEQGMYQTMRKRLPRIGEDVETAKGTAKVRDVHPLQETVRVVFLQSEPPTEEELHINDLPDFCDRPLPDKMPLNMGGKGEKGGRGRRRSRRGLEPLMEPRQPGRSTSGRGRSENKPKGGRGGRGNDNRRDQSKEQNRSRSSRKRKGSRDRSEQRSQPHQPHQQQGPKPTASHQQSEEVVQNNATLQVTETQSVVSVSQEQGGKSVAIDARASSVSVTAEKSGGSEQVVLRSEVVEVSMTSVSIQDGNVAGPTSQASAHKDAEIIPAEGAKEPAAALPPQDKGAKPTKGEGQTESAPSDSVKREETAPTEPSSRPGKGEGGKGGQPQKQGDQKSSNRNRSRRRNKKRKSKNKNKNKGKGGGKGGNS